MPLKQLVYLPEGETHFRMANFVIGLVRQSRFRPPR